ncbi:transposable element Tcb2 transposase [Trichonephila clavipes]|nr:transposable element Tcb2 transposase [Trichonephila clavipes]
MPLRRLRRQYEQHSQFERGRIIGMMEAEWSGRPRQTSRRGDSLIVRNARVQPTASSATIQEQVAHSLGAPVPSRALRRHLVEGRLGSRRPLRVLPLILTHWGLHLEWCRAQGNWTTAEWSHVVFSDESRFNLGSDDNCVGVWRLHGERFNSAFALQRHTTPTTGVRVWGVIVYNTHSSLVLIYGTITAQLYVHDILQPHVYPLMQRRPGAIFEQDNA